MHLFIPGLWGILCDLGTKPARAVAMLKVRCGKSKLVGTGLLNTANPDTKAPHLGGEEIEIQPGPHSLSHSWPCAGYVVSQWGALAELLILRAASAQRKCF